MRNMFFVLLVILGLFVQPSPCLAETLRVVTSFSILADMTREIGGDAVAVQSLVGPNQDMHGFTPTPGDIKELANAQLIIVNGLGFEGWLRRAVTASGTKAKVIEATVGITPLAIDESDHDHHHDHDHAAFDPHAWQDVSLARVYAKNIATALQAALPEQATIIATRAKTYDTKLADLDKEIKDSFAAISPDRRKVITHHDAFGYFAKAYGIEFHSPLGIGTANAAKASDIIALQRQIKAEGIKAVFLENFGSPKLMQQLAQDTGVELGGILYGDALSDASGPAANYIAMIRHNATAIQVAMQR